MGEEVRHGRTWLKQWDEWRHKTPNLQGSEKQIAWAKDIRGDNFSKLKNYVLNQDEYTRKEKEARASNKSVEEITKAVNEVHKVTIARETKEHYVGRALAQRRGGYEFIESKKKIFLDKTYEKYRKGSDEFKKARAEAREKQKKKYRKWLVAEYKKVLENQKSAKWWIENRRT